MPARLIEDRRRHNREWYARNRATAVPVIMARKAARIAGYVARLNALKEGPCTDCGGRFPVVAMDLDHVRGEKRGDVGNLVRSGVGWPVIEAELAKCELVCANCHRVRTSERR